MNTTRKKDLLYRHLTISATLLFCSYCINITTASPVFPNFYPNTSQNFLLVVKDHPTLVNVGQNQALQSAIEEIKILKQPSFGEVKVNNIGSMTFVPTPNTCEEKDEFTYLVRTAEGEETITVSVEILCESLTIINGFSPNGNGEVNTFTILGVQNFPNNSLLIFNKWGEEVYSKKGYQNEWNGEMPDGDSLASEDSVYYYVFNDGKGESYSGYLQIM